MNGTTTPRQKLSGVEESDIADSMQSGHGGAAYEASLDRQSFRRCKLHRAHGVRRKQEPRDSPSSRKKVKKKRKKKAELETDIEIRREIEKGGRKILGVLGRDSEAQIE